VVADGTKAIVHISAPDRPLALAFKPDGSLDPEGSGPYQVHGRTIAGQNGNDDFTFAPREQTCELTPLMASNTIPSSVGMAAASGPAGNVAIPFANFRILCGRPNLSKQEPPEKVQTKAELLPNLTFICTTLSLKPGFMAL
jgi:hypothetical protein